MQLSRAASLVEILRHHAALRPNAIAFTFLREGDAGEEHATYAEIDRRARAVAALLQRDHRAGERAILLFPSGIDYIVAFFGCLYSGIIAVPAYPPNPSRLQRTLPRLLGIAEDAGATMVLTTSMIASMAEMIFELAPQFRGMQWVGVDAVESDIENDWKDPNADRSSVAFLQYTSGSTGSPKGVVVTHGNLVANVEMARHVFQSTPDSTGVSWLPMYHDMGLIGSVLQTVYVGGRSILISPLEFLQKPLRWLRALSDYKGTHSGAPNFAYDLCARRITKQERETLDLRSWRLAFCGAEPVRPEAMNRFFEAFAECGFDSRAFLPCYGLAEASLFVTGGTKASAPIVLPVDADQLLKGHIVQPTPLGGVRHIVSCGEPAPECRVVIVDPVTGERFGEDRVGEVWIAGEHVCRGYWERPEESRATFRAHLKGADTEPFLRSGDLGFLHAGELYIAGRQKDVIIIRGRNYYPQDIEQAAEESYARLRKGCCAAFTVTIDGEERLVVALEIEARGKAFKTPPSTTHGSAPSHRTVDEMGSDGRIRLTAAAVFQSIRHAIVEHTDLSVYAVVLVKAGTIPKTSSGKIQRRACRAAFLEGALEVVAEDVADTGSGSEPSGLSSEARLRALQSSARLEDLRARAHSDSARMRVAAGAQDTRSESRVTSHSELRRAVAAVLGISAGSLDATRPLRSYGLDSLGVVDVMHIVESHGVRVSPERFFAGISFGEVEELVRQAQTHRSDGEAETVESIHAMPFDRTCLSSAQKGLWFLDRTLPDRVAYHLQFGLRLHGDVDASLIEKSLDEIVKRHDVLRTTYRDHEGAPELVLHAELPIRLALHDARSAPLAGRELHLAEIARADALAPFDLEHGPLLRGALVRTDEREHVLLLTAHHIVLDGWSIGVFGRELSIAYNAFAQGRPLDLPMPAFQYNDFAQWQRDWLRSSECAEHFQYWKRTLRNLPHLTLLGEKQRASPRSYRGGTEQFSLSRELTEKLKALAMSENATLFTVLVTAFGTLLHRYSEQDDFGIGTIVANRTDRFTRGIVGCLVNTLVLRWDSHGHPTFRGSLHRMQTSVLEALKHERVPFDQIVRAAGGSRNHGLNALIDACFVMENIPLTEVAFSGASATPYVQTVDGSVEGGAKYDVYLAMAESSQSSSGLRGTLEFSLDILDREIARAMIESFRALLESVAERPDEALHRLPLLSEAERRTLLLDWNNTTADYPRDECIHELFEKQAARTPAAVALEYEGVTLTYAELDARANQLAHRLVSLGVTPEVFVALSVERSLDMVVGILGILKAGGAFVPLDPVYPHDRLAYMLADSNVRLLVTQRRLVQRLPVPEGGEVVVLEANDEWPRTPVRKTANADSPAYLAYTSGSTGEPKGVVALHRGTVNRLHWMWTTFPFGAADVACQKTSLNFVDSIWEIFGPLLRGVRSILFATDTTRDPFDLVRQLAAKKVTHIVVVPSLLRAMIAAATELGETLPHLRRWTTSGEALTVELAHQFAATFPHATLLNLYGSSEVAADSTYYVVPLRNIGNTVPIGKPIANTSIYIVGQEMELLPRGLVGELCIGGDGLARGYLGRAALTGTKFIANPFGAGRIYRTGDRARWRADGEIEYVGRVDYQVKVRGVRIELGEIEAALSELPGVEASVVIARSDVSGDVRLVGYVAVAHGSTWTTTSLREALEAKLPVHLIPTSLVPLNELPLTPNGKIDRNALPAFGLPENAKYAAPQTSMEQLVASIWADVLQARSVGLHDHFFDLGGHSLLATQVMSRLRSALKVDVPVRTLFESPTVAAFAHAVTARMHGATPALPSPASLAATDRTSGVLIPSVGRGFPAGYAQELMWLNAQLESGTSFYVLPFAARVRGPVDVDAFALSLKDLVQRHEVLRTTLRLHDGELTQVLREHADVDLQVVDYGAITPASRDLEVTRCAEDLLREPMNLETGPLVRASLVRLEEREHVLLLAIHHVAVDGFSAHALFSDFWGLYLHRVGAVSLPPPPALQYLDFTAWQRAWLTSERMAVQISYWSTTLKDAADTIALPFDRPATSTRPARGDIRSITLADGLIQALEARGRTHRVSLFMTLFAALSSSLARWAEQDDVVIGTVVANRTAEGSERIVGNFINFLALRGGVRRDMTPRMILESVRERVLDGFANQDVPFEKVVDALRRVRGHATDRLYNVAFLLQNFHFSPPNVSTYGVQVDVEQLVPPRPPVLDLRFVAGRSRDGMHLACEFDPERFDGETIEHVLELVKGTLDVWFERIDEPIDRFDIPERRKRHSPTALRETDRDQVLFAWNDTAVPYPQGECIHELFEQQAKRTPGAIAVEFENTTLTYAELDLRANEIANDLVSLGVGPDVLVGICLGRSVEMMVGLLAVLKAGGAYVPLDPSYPKERLAFMLSDSNVALVLAQTAFRDRIPEKSVRVVCLDHDGPARRSTTKPQSSVTAANMAYVIYTSGSTGKPKGACNLHSGVVNRLRWMQDAFSIGPTDVVFQKTPISFDVSVWELFWPIMTGARLLFARPEGHKDPNYLRDTIEARGVTTMHFVPSMLTTFLETPEIERCKSLRRVMCSGEALSMDHVRRFKTRVGCPLHNLYGPTEVAVDATWWPCTDDETSAMAPIGRPIANTRTYVLDGDLSPVAVGEMGELFLAGVQVGPGYLNLPALTKERFLPDPFARHSSDRMYRTGDLARWRSDGNLEFLGRMDHQVKIRGFRIELGEIESMLLAAPGVTASVVVAREDVPSEKRLVAYVVLAANAQTTTAALRASLEAKLPEYMIPNAIVVLDALPLLPNGKIDRKALPAPEVNVSPNAFVAPRTREEILLTEIWQDILGLTKVGVRDDFFALGGHSLLAVRAVAKVEERTGIRLPLAGLIARTTIEALAPLLALGSRQSSSPLVPLQSRGAGAPLFFVHPAGGTVACYHELAQQIGQEQPFYGLQARGIDGNEAPLDRMEAIAHGYIEAVIARQPKGPYRIGGWSQGGAVAFEMARQLEAAGERVSALVLVDSVAPRLLPSRDPSERFVAFAREAGFEIGADDLRSSTIEEALRKMAERASRDGLLPPSLGEEYVRRIWRVLEANIRAYQRYEPHRVHVPVSLVRAEQSDFFTCGSATYGWDAHAPSVTTVDVACSHDDIVRPPHVARLAKSIRRALSSGGSEDRR